MKTPRSSPRVNFYELLEVQKTATEQEIKKAYRKNPVKCHPDKPGGNRELFEKVKYASDVLCDPYKRKAYDQYGELAVKLMEKNFSMDSAEIAMQLFLGIGPCERLLLILLLTLLIGYFLLTPILLAVRWDHPRSMSFAHVFVPVWIGLSLVLCFCLCCVQVPPADEEDGLDEQAKKEHDQQREEHAGEARKLKWGSTTIILILSLLLFFLVLRLDGETHWSFFLVIWPWILLEVGLLVYKFWSAEGIFLMTGNNPEVIQQQKWLNKDWNCFFLALTSSNVFHIVFACLLASKMDGMKISWWEVFAPFWVEFVLSVVLSLCKCGSLKTEEELNQMPPEVRIRHETRGSIVATIIAHCVWLGCVVLVCWKLSHPSAFPAWVIFVPLFAFSCCFCCCLSCLLCCMRPEMMHAEDEETGEGRPMYPQPGQQGYSTMIDRKSVV